MTTIPIQLGTTWADKDPRHPGRQVRPLAIDGDHVVVELVSVRTWPNRSASLLDTDPRRAQPGRITRIRVDQFARRYSLATR